MEQLNKQQRKKEEEQLLQHMSKKEEKEEELQHEIRQIKNQLVEKASLEKEDRAALKSRYKSTRSTRPKRRRASDAGYISAR